MRYWKRINPDGSTRTVESYSHDLDVEGAIEIDRQEFQDFLDGLPPGQPAESRDLRAEIDQLRADVDQLQKRP